MALKNFAFFFLKKWLLIRACRSQNLSKFQKISENWKELGPEANPPEIIFPNSPNGHMKQSKPSSLSLYTLYIHPPSFSLSHKSNTLSLVLLLFSSQRNPEREIERGKKEEMTRKRVRMEKITHEPTRLATFKKRKACIMKKARELSVLCSIPVYVEVSDGPNSAPEVWPRSEKEASEIINRFESMTESEKTKKMVNKDGFVSQQILKKQMQLQKVLRECQELEDRVLLRNLLAGKCSFGDLRDREVVMRFWSLLETQMRDIQKRKEQQVSVSSPVPVQSDPGCGTISMTAILPVREKNFSPLIGESVEKEGFFDPLLQLEGEQEIQMPPLAAKSDDNFESLPDWCSVGKEISESVNKSHEKDPIFESISAVVASEEKKLDEICESGGDLLALPDWLKSGDELAVLDWPKADEEMMRLFDQFGDNQEMVDILWSF